MNQTKTLPQETDFVDLIREGKEGNIRRILLENANNSNKLNLLLTKKYGQFKQTALHLAVKYGHKGIVKLLLEYGADIHATDVHKRTALHTATDENEGIDIIELILESKGVNVNAIEEYGNTPVKLAAEKGNSGAVRLLMENRADVTIADKGENTALHVAAKRPHIDVIKLLLEKPAHKGIIGKQNKDKNTPLHLAVESKSEHCVALLLNAGATYTMAVKNQHDQTAADLAKEHGNKEIIELLKDPQKAKELFQEKPKPTKTAPRQFGRGCSVEADSSATNSSYQMTLSIPQELMQQNHQNVPQVQVYTNNVIINQQFSTTVNGGNVAIGPGSQAANVQHPTANAQSQPLYPGQHVPSGESHYEINVTGGNASVGDNSVINVSTGTSRTSTNASVPHPVQVESPMKKSDTLLPHQLVPEEKSPPSSIKVSTKFRQVLEEKSPMDHKSNASLPHMVEELPTTNKLQSFKEKAKPTTSLQQESGGSVESNSCQEGGQVTIQRQFTAIPRDSHVVTAQPALSVPPEVLTRGPMAMEGYKNALAEGKTCVKRVPLMFIGQDQAGKTSTKKSLRGLSFNPNEECTVGIDVDPSHFKLSNEIWKTGGKDQEENAEMAISFEHQTARVLVDWLKEEGRPSAQQSAEKIGEGRVKEKGKAIEKKREPATNGKSYDSTSYSDDSKESPLSEPSKGQEQMQTPGDSVGLTPEDVATFASPEQEFEEIAAIAEKLLQDDGLKNGDVYSVLWDFAGQSVYYVTHVLFLTRRAIYFLVYDLSQNPHDTAKPLLRQGVYEEFEDRYSLKTNLDYLDLWMTSVASLASQDEDDTVSKSDLSPKKNPVVFLVCTHADNPHSGGDPRKAANEVFGFLKSKAYGSHLYDVFCVDNTKSGGESECPEVVRLREEVLAVSNELPFVNEAIPVKWLKYEKALQMMLESGHKCLSLNGAKYLASKACKINSDEVRMLLNFLHDMRILIHFDDAPELDDLVVLDPQWLIDVFKKVITVTPRYQMKEKKFEDLWLKLEREGILVKDLIEHVWSDLIPRQETTKSLIAVLEKFGLLCPWPSSDGSCSEQYLVPSMLKSHPPDDVMKLAESAQIPSLFIKFDSDRVPPGLFPRLVLQFYQWRKQEFLTPGNPKLYQNFARFFMSGGERCSVTLLCHPSSIEVVYHNVEFQGGCLLKRTVSTDFACNTSDFTPTRALRRQLGLILELMRKQFHFLNNMKYQLSILCPVCCKGRAVVYCDSHHVKHCKKEECFHLRSESELRKAEGRICTKSASAQNITVDARYWEPWFASPDVQAAIGNCDKRHLSSHEGSEEKALAVPCEILRSLLSESSDSREVVSRLNEKLEQSSLKEPDPRTKELIRSFAKEAKSLERLDVVEHLREIVPAGTTGPLLPESLDVRNIPLKQGRDLTISLSGGDEWKLVAEKLGMTPQEVRYLDKRVLNPADAMIAHIASLYFITVEDLYDLLVDCDLPVMADIL